MNIGPARHPVQCVLPPYVLSNIARNGSGEQRDMALRHLSTDQSVRSLRVQRTLLGVPGRRRLAFGDPVPHRTVFDSAGDESEPPNGSVVRREGDGPTGDPAVDEAYDGLGATFAFFLDAYDRNSIDDEGMPLDAYVHYSTGYSNAFWDGRQMVFGDGDGELFRRFTTSLDVIGHELAHGVTEDEAQLIYHDQSGALNESMSDVFGALVVQHAKGQSAEAADWLIGADLLTDKVAGRALRDMREPGTAYDDPVLGRDPQPAHMDDFVRTTQDNGGVHINSGIPNRAFVLAALNLGGKAWEGAGQVWYDTLRDSRIRPTTRFSTFARATVRVAEASLGLDAGKAVREAWAEVGVEVRGAR